MTINWPDRIKVAIFGIILVPFISLVAFLLLAFTGVFTIISMNQGVAISIVIAIVLDACYTVRRWRKLKQDENAGNIPDMTNRNNIGLPRTIMSIVIIVLIVAAYINYKLYSVALAKLLLLACITISVIEIIYLKLRRELLAKVLSLNNRRRTWGTFPPLPGKKLL
jgi:hypothetical protein